MHRVFFTVAVVLFLIGMFLPAFKEWVGTESPTLWREQLRIQYSEKAAEKVRQLETEHFMSRCAWFGGAAVFFIGGLIKSPRREPIGRV